MKKAFTLVELIAAIAIIVVISLLVIPKIITTIKDNNLKLYHEMEDRLEEAALSYCIDNYCSDNEVIDINTLVSSSYTSAVRDLTDESSCTGRVFVDNNTTANAYITCTNYNTPILLLYDIIKLQAVNTKVDFSVINSGGNGVYKTSTNSVPTEDNVEVYFFRGTHAGVNNNVIFNGMCWKIIRTTELQGVRMIYNGTPVDGKCTNTTGSSTQIGTSAFNTSNNDNAYVGYMYGIAGSSTYAATHTNTNNSTIKTSVDAWYKTNFVDNNSDKALQLEDSVYCNDRSIVAYDSTKIGTNDYSSYGTLGYGTNATLYGAANRAWYKTSIPSPSLSCANENDKFTVSDTNGNGALTYKVGLVTLDEVVLAGFNTYASNTSAYQNTTNYLYTNSYYWTLSPVVFFSRGRADVGGVASVGGVGSDFVNGRYGVRPVISLLHSTTISSGDGSMNTPYVIE